MGFLFTNLFDPDRLCARVREMDAKITSSKMNEPMGGRFERRRAHEVARDADDLCGRISERALELKFQLSDIQDWFSPPPTPEFSTNGATSLRDWKPKRRAGQTAPRCEAMVENGVLHLHSANGPLAVSLQTRVTLPLGNYRLSGENIATNSAGVTNLITLAVVRYATERFAVERQSANGRSINLPVQVNTARAPEEIECICEIRDEGSDVWFNLSSLKLIKAQEPFAFR